MFTLPKGSTPTAENIKMAIEYNEEINKDDLTKAKKYYDGDHAIKYRKKEGVLANNKVMVNHAKYITKINVGYLLGNPIEYLVKDDADFDIQPILDEYDKQVIYNIDKKIGKGKSKYGYAFEYIYADQDNNIISKDLEPFNCVVAYDDTMEHSELFAVIYTEYNEDKKEYVGVWTVDNFEKITWNEKLTEPTGSIAHNFGIVPVIEYDNDSDKVGDYTDVMDLIDAYNTVQSDRVNDKEQLVSALMIIYGFKLSENQLSMMKKNRVMSAPSQIKGAKVEYLTKQLAEAELDILRGSIEDDIHKISMTPNMTDREFVGNSSGVALKYKLMPFEISINDKQATFEVGLRKRLRIYNKYLSMIDSSIKEIPVHKVEIKFKKSLPQNDLETSQMMGLLSDFVDKETLLTQLSFIEDVKDVAKKKEKEAKKSAKLFNPQFGTNNPTGDDEDE